MFVLIWMHFSWWFWISSPNSIIWHFLKKIYETFDYVSCAYACLVVSVKVHFPTSASPGNTFSLLGQHTSQFKKQTELLTLLCNTNQFEYIWRIWQAIRIIRKYKAASGNVQICSFHIDVNIIITMWVILKAMIWC